MDKHVGADAVVKLSVVCDKETNIAFASNQIIFGWNREAFKNEHAGKLINIINPEDRESFLNMVKNSSHGIFRTTDINSQNRYILVECIGADDSSGRIRLDIFDVSVIIDLDNNMTTRIGAYVDDFVVGIALVSVSEKIDILYGNKGAYHMCGLPHEKNLNLLNEMVTKILPEDINKIHKTFADAVGTDKLVELIYRVPDMYGEIRYRRIIAIQVNHQSKEPVFFTLVTDTSSEYLAQEKSKKDSITMGAVINNVPVAIVTLKIAEKPIATYANLEAYKLIGWNPEDFANKEIDASAFIYKEEADGLFQEIRAAARDKRMVTRTLRIVRKDGETRWCYCRFTIIHALNKALVVAAILVDVTEQMDNQLQLDVMQNSLNLAFEMTNVCIWEYDLASQCIKRLRNDNHGRCSDVTYHRQKLEKVIQENGKHLLTIGQVEESSIEYLSNMFKLIDKGEPKGECILRVKGMGDGSYLVKMTFVCLYDRDGKPYKAVGITTEASNINEEENWFAQEEIIFDGISSYSAPPVGAFMVNLTKNVVERYKGLDEYLEIFKKLNTWDLVLEVGKNFIGYDEDKLDLVKKFNRKILLENHALGNRVIAETYRLKDINGRIQWTHFYVSLANEPITGDVYLFGYVRNVSRIRSTEMFLDGNPEIACHSGAYSLKTAAAMDRILTRSDHPASKCVMAIVEAGNYDEIIARTSMDFANQVTLTTGRIIKLLFDDMCTVARINNCRFMIMASGDGAAEFLVERFTLLKKAIQMPYLYEGHREIFQFFIGICAETRITANFDSMIKKAEKAIEAARGSGSVKSFIYEGEAKENDKGINPFLIKEKGIQKLTDDTLMHITSEMLFAQDAAETIKMLLVAMLRYFDADNVHIIDIDVDGKGCSIIHEEREDCSEPHIDNEDYGDLSNMPMYNRAYERTSPILIRDVAFASGVEEFEFMENQGLQSLFVVPFMFGNRVAGMVGIDNPKDNIKDEEALSGMVYLIASQLTGQRVAAGKGYAAHDPMTGHFTRSSYGEYANSFKSDAISSVGVVCADINNLKGINEQMGSSYGDRIILDLSAKLFEHFENEDVFRFTGDEFIVICKDFTYDAFKTKVHQFKKDLETLHTGSVSVGYTWGNQEIDLKTMVAHSEERMHAVKHEYYKVKNKASKHFDPHMMKELQEDIRNNRYQMYLQPKAKMSNSSIVGAEALVRMHHPDKGIVYPDKFVPTFEHNNMIKYIDMFIFEEVLKVLEKWKKEGKRLITISFNLSRSTVCEPGLLEMMRAIHDKYDVDRKYVEVEITESIGDVEIEMIKQVCKELTDDGYRLSLDDFGSKYSSLYVLTAMHFNVVKLDKSVVNDVLINPTTQLLIKNIFGFCNTVGMECVAEGVETIEQFQKLRELGCTYAQGYLFNKPITWERFEEKYILDL